MSTAMASLSLRGVFTALVTPFTTDARKVDFDALERLVARQLKGRVSGLVPCGTTGEAPTLSAAEHKDVIRCVVGASSGKLPVLAGTGTNSTQDSIEASREAVAAGADAVMIVTPYYNKPSQEGVIRHVRLIAQAIDAPVVLYNIPARTGVTLSVPTVLRILDECDNVVGVKDATGNVLHCQELVYRAKNRVSVMCGDDALTLSMMSVGARGVISVTSNLLPDEVAEVVRLLERGDLEGARRRHGDLLPIHQALFCEPSPQPIKAALARKGLISPALRPPLIPASQATEARLQTVLAQYTAAHRSERSA